MAHFYLPDFYYKYAVNIRLIELIQNHPEWFYENFQVGAVYGTFPGAIWNGGRVFHGTTDGHNIAETINSFNRLGVAVRFTFTNCLLEEKHVHDTYCNFIMEKANNGMNEVLVNSPLLEAYLRKEYPNFKYILSTTRCERHVDAINAACKVYDLVVPDYRDVFDEWFMSHLDCKEKIELLINERCPLDCSIRAEHYKNISRCQLTFEDDPGCRYAEKHQNLCEKHVTSLSTDEVLKLRDEGFEHFKLEGRTLHMFDAIENYVRYMVRPEFKDGVRRILVKHVWK